MKRSHTLSLSYSVSPTIAAPPRPPGTIIQSWSDNATNAKCAKFEGADPTPLMSEGGLPEGVDGPTSFSNDALMSTTTSNDTSKGSPYPSPNTGYGVLFNAMINPFTVGPMALTSFIWFQGESNCCGGPYYSCAQNAMIEMWRSYFKKPTAFFGFVELEPWIGTNPSLAVFRKAQLASLALVRSMCAGVLYVWYHVYTNEGVVGRRRGGDAGTRGGRSAQRNVHIR